MTIHADLFGLPVEEFDIYFRNDNMLDYLKERAENWNWAWRKPRNCARS